MRPTGVLLAALVFGCSGPVPAPSVADRRAALERQAAEERQGAATVDAYSPKVAGQIDAPDAPAAEILRQLPGVTGVEVLVSVPRPARRIIHFRDWHFVPRDLFALEARQSAGKPLTDADVDALHRELELQAELVQNEQEAALRCLVKHHGLKRVLAEGLTPQGAANYRDVIGALRETDERLAALQRDHAPLKGKSPDVDRQIGELLRDHRRDLVPFGAAGRLAVRREVEVMPLDDEETLDRARPVTADGKVKADAAKVEARHDAQVRAALDSGPVAVIILGGGHDLSAAVRRAGSDIEYVRVSMGRYNTFADSR